MSYNTSVRITVVKKVPRGISISKEITKVSTFRFMVNESSGQSVTEKTRSKFIPEYNIQDVHSPDQTAIKTMSQLELRGQERHHLHLLLKTLLL